MDRRSDRGSWQEMANVGWDPGQALVGTGRFTGLAGRKSGSIDRMYVTATTRRRRRPAGAWRRGRERQREAAAPVVGAGGGGGGDNEEEEGGATVERLRE